MTEITAAMVKALRELTDAGMMECKKALVEAKGDLKAAESLIAQWGHRKAAKSEARTAAEGRIQIAHLPNAVAMIEVNCETDFVARDPSFIEFCEQVAEKAVSDGVQEVDALLALPYAQDNINIEEARKNLVARIGENIQIRRVGFCKVEPSERIGSYTHHARIGACVAVKGGDEVLSKELAMHIAAMKPLYITLEEVPEAVIEKQKESLFESAKQSGKSPELLEKIVAGQLQKYLNEICLVGQSFFKDPEQSVGAVLKQGEAQVRQMLRFEVGEGIEIVKKSFEEEVMSARGN